MWPEQPVIPDDSWGVLGPTTCPYCQALRRNTGFGLSLLLIGLAGYWFLAVKRA